MTARSAAAAAILLMTQWPAPGRTLGEFRGTFEIARRQITVTREALGSAAAEVSRRGCRETIHVLALVNNQFSPADLTAYGWRLVSTVGDVVTLEGCRQTAPYLTALPGISYVKMPSRIFACSDSARRLTKVDQVHAGTGLPRTYTGKGVVLGMIDTDFDTRHPAFLDSTGTTRFIGVWDQQDTAKGFPNSYGYGVMKTGRQLQTDSMLGLSTAVHGSLMTSYAVASDRTTKYYGMAPGAMIAAVKHGPSDANLVDGLKWIFHLADSLKAPCVVNMSIGVAEGPHDGRSLIDKSIDSLVKAGRIIVGSMGNDGDKQTHCAFALQRGQAGGTWVVSEVSTNPATSRVQTTSVVDMWGDSGTTFSDTFYILDTTTMQYKRSGAALTTTVTGQYVPDTIPWPNAATGKTDTVILYLIVERSSTLNHKPHIWAGMIGNNPNLFLGFRVTTTSTRDTVHAWNGAKIALKSFGIPGYSDGDSSISVNEIGGTAKRIIAVGAYTSRILLPHWNGSTIHGQWEDGSHGLCHYSSQGPTVDGRTKPDICAPGSDVVGAISRMYTDTSMLVLWPAPPSFVNCYAYTGGTSVSSPIVAGIIALILQADSSLTPEKTRQILQQTAITDSYTGQITTPNNRWGAGKVNALSAVAAVLGVTQRAGEAPETAPARALEIVNCAHGFLRLRGVAPGGLAGAKAALFSLHGRLIASVAVDKHGAIELPRSVLRGAFVARVERRGSVLCEGTFAGLR